MTNRFKYDFYAKVIDITTNYIVVMCYDGTYKYLKATLLQKLKVKMDKWYYIKTDDLYNIIEMVRVKYEK